MILLQISRCLIIVYIFSVPLIIFIYADSSYKASKITLQSEAVTINVKVEANNVIDEIRNPNDETRNAKNNEITKPNNEKGVFSIGSFNPLPYLRKKLTSFRNVVKRLMYWDKSTTPDSRSSPNISVIKSKLVRSDGLNRSDTPGKGDRSDRSDGPPISWEYQAKNVAFFAYKGGKENMEDRLFIDEDFEDTGVSVYAIFDGHEGDFSAQYAVDNLMKSLEEKIIKLKTSPNLDENLKKRYMENDTIKYVNLLKDEIMAFDKKLLNILTIQKIQQILNSQKRNIKFNPEEYTLEDGTINIEKVINHRIIAEEKELTQTPYLSGTAVFITIIEEDQLFVANLGNKPIILNENNISLSLGDLEKKLLNKREARPSVHPCNLFEEKTESLILASSGLWNTFSDYNEISTFIRRNIEKRFFGAKSIAFEAEKRGRKQEPPIEADNITVIILKTNIQERIVLEDILQGK